MDKQDELALAIENSIWPLAEWDGDPTNCRIAAITAAKAVRCFMGSDEVQNNAALAAWKSWGRRRSGPFHELHHDTQQKYKVLARAALSAAIGEDIGGGRG